MRYYKGVRRCKRRAILPATGVAKMTPSRKSYAKSTHRFGAENLTVREISELTGIKYATLYLRLVIMNWDYETAISKPLRGSVDYPRKSTSPYMPVEARPCTACGKMKRPRQQSDLCDGCKTLICEQCACPFIRRGANRPNRFCTVACQAEYQKSLTGEKAGNWQGGVDARNRNYRAKLRCTPEHKEWRRKVLDRDGNTCVRCGFVGTGSRGRATLHAHHKKSFARYPKLRFDVDNGVTLCVPCHSQIHRKPKQGRLFKRLPYRTKSQTTNIKNKYRCHKATN